MWTSRSEKIFKRCQCIFIILLLSPLDNGRGPFLFLFLTNLNPFHPECFVPSKVLIVLVCWGKKRFESRHFYYVDIIGMAFVLRELKFLLSKDALYYLRLILVQMSWRRKFYLFVCLGALLPSLEYLTHMEP